MQRFPLAAFVVAELAARLDEARVAERLLPVVAALPFPALTWGRTGYVFEGFTADVVGRLQAVLGRWNEAADALENAVESADQFRARPALVESRIALAGVLARRARPGDQTRAEQLCELAETDAVELDMQASLRRLRALGSAEPQTSAQVPAGAGIDLVRDGEIWSITTQGRTLRLKHSRALDLLKHLLDHPGREFHVLELGQPADAVIDVGDAGELLDQRAKSAYQSRLEELRGELAEAERWNDPGRSARAQAEIEFLHDELGRAAGAGGRLRRSAGAAERARVNVHKRLRGLIKRIAAGLPELGQHLEASIKTGVFVSYQARTPARHGP